MSWKLDYKRLHFFVIRKSPDKLDLTQGKVFLDEIDLVQDFALSG
jgi:hypothetical protein